MKTKEEILELVINNPDEYNNFKNETSDELDLSESDFSGKELYDIDFTDADLVDSSFFEATLTKCSFVNCDLTSVDFTRAKIVECDFSESLLSGTNLSYATVEYCNFSDADMSGSIMLETTFDNTDFSSAVNLQASRFDESTVWPDDEYLPSDFDSTASSDLSSLQDEEEYSGNNDY